MRLLTCLLTSVALLLAPFVLSNHALYLVSLVAATSIVVTGLAIVTGLAGQISLAQGAFAALGAYGMVILAKTTGVPYWIGLPLLVAGAAGFGYLFGALALRVEDHYLALATMAVSAIMQLLLTHLESFTGGAVGLPVAALRIGEVTVAKPAMLYALIVPIAVASIWFLWTLSHSRFGRAFGALRMTEVGAAATGIDVLHYKSLAFALSAAFAALGGGLIALLTTYLDPAQFGIIESVRLIAIAVVGGLRSPFGPVIGGAIFVMLPEYLGGLGSYMTLAFFVLLLVCMMVAPMGLGGLAQRWTSKRAFGSGVRAP
jgi:branched-chain amino acid transport system permease protein